MSCGPRFDLAITQGLLESTTEVPSGDTWKITGSLVVVASARTSRTESWNVRKIGRCSRQVVDPVGASPTEIALQIVTRVECHPAGERGNPRPRKTVHTTIGIRVKRFPLALCQRNQQLVSYQSLKRPIRLSVRLARAGSND